RGLLQELLAPDLLAQLAGPRLELLDLGVDVRDLGRDLDRVEALELLAEPLDLRLESLDLALGVSLAAVMLLERGVRLGPDLLHPGLGLSVRLRLRLELLHPLARGTEGLLGNPRSEEHT